MIEDLRTDYKSDILMPVQQDKRTFNILDSNNNILYENVHIEDNSQYLQVGDEYGSDIINAQNSAINTLARGTGLTFDTYQDYLDAKALGEVPVGSIIYIKEGNSTVITANQVTYNDSNVKLALDTVISRIAQINDDLSKRLIFPDYANASSLVTVGAVGVNDTAVYTATEDCFINITDFLLSNSGTAYLKINGKVIGLIAFNTFRYWGGLFPLQKGDVVTIQQNASTANANVRYSIVPFI